MTGPREAALRQMREAKHVAAVRKALTKLVEPVTATKPVASRATKPVAATATVACPDCQKAQERIALLEAEVAMLLRAGKPPAMTSTERSRKRRAKTNETRVGRHASPPGRGP
jgi:hypothetical protein